MTYDPYKLLQKAGQSGNAHRLLPTGRIDEVAIETWLTCFVASLKDDQHAKMLNFQFLWRRGDDKKGADHPKRGIASNIKQLVLLMADGRISREETGVELAQWLEVLKLDEFYSADIEEEKDDDGEVITEARAATPDKLRVEVDKIVNTITNSYYLADGVPGTTTERYFKDAKESIKAFDTICANTSIYLVMDIVSSFESGAYKNWDAVMKATRRFYGVDECQETMIDMFDKITKIVKSNKRMETKVTKFRELVARFAITKKEDFIKAEDFEDDTGAAQRFPEHYGPFINSMFTYLVFKECIPNNKWEGVQNMFYKNIPKPTYENWHLNRYELYKIIDRERSSTALNSVSTRRTDDENEINAITRRGRGRGGRGGARGFQRSFTRGARGRGGAGGRPPARGGARGGRPSRGGVSRSFANKKCRNCSYWMGRPVHHNRPYTGLSDSKCLYTPDGKRRQGYEEIKAAEEQSEEHHNDELREEEQDYGEDARVEAAEEYDDYYGGDYGDEYGVYGISEGAYLPKFAGKNGGLAIGSNE